VDEYQYWKIDNDGIQIAIHDAKSFAEYAHPPRSESNLTHLYFKVANQQHFLEHLEKIGVTPFCSDDVVVTVIDPDGRKVMFGTA